METKSDRYARGDLEVLHRVRREQEEGTHGRSRGSRWSLVAFQPRTTLREREKEVR